MTNLFIAKPKSSRYDYEDILCLNPKENEAPAWNTEHYSSFDLFVPIMVSEFKWEKGSRLRVKVIFDFRPWDYLQGPIRLVSMMKNQWLTKVSTLTFS